MIGTLTEYVRRHHIGTMCNLTGGTSPAISNLPIRLFSLD